MAEDDGGAVKRSAVLGRHGAELGDGSLGVGDEGTGIGKGAVNHPVRCVLVFVSKEGDVAEYNNESDGG